MELLNNHGEVRMDRRKDMAVEAVLEQLIESGPGEIGSVFARAFELAMQIERERFLGAAHYERTLDRRGYANGYKPKRIDTPAGTVSVQVPKTAGHEGEPFYPQSLERGRRSVRAVMLAVAEMYIKGVSTRQAEAVMREFGIESLSSSQVSRAAKLLDDELEAWRTRTLGEVKYLVLDARYEKMRHGGVVRDAAVLSAIGIGADERRRVLGVSVALSEAEVHWRGFLESLVARGLRGVEFITSDDHAGLRAARRAVLGGATWQRCQFHLARNAIHHAPNAEIRKRIGAELRAVWNASKLTKAEAALAELVASYRDTAPNLPLRVFRCQSRLNRMAIQTIIGINQNNRLEGRERSTSGPSPPPLALAKAFSPFGSGRIFPFFQGLYGRG